MKLFPSKASYGHNEYYSSTIYSIHISNAMRMKNMGEKEIDTFFKDQLTLIHVLTVASALNEITV
jgi:hypothetical protein